MKGRFDSGRWRSAVVVSLLLAVIVLVAVLTGQAYYAARSHRETAEMVHRDYSRLVADEFIRRVTADVGYYGYYPLITGLRRSVPPGDRGALPSRESLAARLEERARRAISLASSFFLADPDGRIIEVAGADLDVGVREWLQRELRNAAAASARADGPFSVVHGRINGRPRSIVYTTLNGSAHDGARFAGFEVDTEALVPWFERAVGKGPLLPSFLGGGDLGNDLLYISLRDVAGLEVFRLGTAFDDAPTVSTPFGETYNGLLEGMIVLTSINPAATPRLAIGGLPRSRVPVLLGLLILTTGLLLAAIYVLRRERALDQMRSEFIARVSHELRTPLTQIRMFAETLLLGRVRSADEHRRSLEIIDQETRRLSHLVENILQFSRGERRAVRLALRRIEIAHLVQDTVESFRPLARHRGARIALHLEHGAHSSVDEDAMRQVLLNLLDNALKYGPADQEIRIGMSRAASAIRIWVEDQGPGVPDRERERIWARFRRLERDVRAATAGTGIGLTVVRDLVGMHGGRVWVEKGDRGGARFTVELPSLEPERAAHEAPVPDNPLASAPNRPEGVQ